MKLLKMDAEQMQSRPIGFILPPLWVETQVMLGGILAIHSSSLIASVQHCQFVCTSLSSAMCQGEEVSSIELAHAVCTTSTTLNDRYTTNSSLNTACEYKCAKAEEVSSRIGTCSSIKKA